MVVFSPLSQADLADGVPAPALWGLSELHQIVLPQEEAPSGDLPPAPLWPDSDGHWQWQHCPQHSHLWVSWEPPAPSALSLSLGLEFCVQPLQEREFPESSQNNVQPHRVGMRGEGRGQGDSEWQWGTLKTRSDSIWTPLVCSVCFWRHQSL